MKAKKIELLGFASMVLVLFAQGFVMAATPNNTSLMYPLQEVSRVECRTTSWTDHDVTCRMPLPRIKGGVYQNFLISKDHTDTYGVLRKGSYIKSKWNREGSHVGVDISTAKGTPIFAIGDGKIIEARQQAGYGNVIKMEFVYKNKQYFATYAHLHTFGPNIKVGSIVKKGDKLGEVGNTGVAGGALGGFHLHFEINIPIDGRLVYAFWECADWKNGTNDMGVVNDGLCRDTLEKRTIDPIVFLESANATIKTESISIVPDTTSQPVVDTIPLIPTPVDTKPDFITPTTQTNGIKINTLQTTFMDTATKNFVNTYDFTINTETTVQLNQSVKVVVSAKNKTNSQGYNGILPATLQLVSPSNTALSITPMQVSLMAGSATFTVTPKQLGTHSVVVTFANQQLATIPFVVSAGTNQVVGSTPGSNKFKCRYTTQTQKMQYFF